MNNNVGQRDFVKAALTEIASHLSRKTPDVHAAISAATGLQDPAEVEKQRQLLADQFAGIAAAAGVETAEPYTHYVSRFDGVGVFQSVLAKLFEDIPDLQGYGDKNPSWLATVVEQSIHALKGFFAEVYTDVHGRHKPLLQSVLEAWKELRFDRAPYPTGMPKPIAFADEGVAIALLADWGGDNPAARKVAAVVRTARPDYAVHLGDIYYGGVKEECETFLRLWPLQTDAVNPGAGIPAGSSFALNGNHEMYSGGESYFNVVLPALGQPQPFFCLQNAHWRVIGLDTAYAQGRLKPSGPDDAIAPQWSWLVGLLKLNDGGANILLTHHQPVSAHAAEYGQSQGLRDDVAALLASEGIPENAIFGWFFGHEHRAAIYDDKTTPYNARLIGSGCIPHLVQTERACDPNCTPFRDVNGRGEYGTKSAISMCAVLRFTGAHLLIVYTDEDNIDWGSETWNAQEGRLNGTPFAVNESTFLN